MDNRLTIRNFFIKMLENIIRVNFVARWRNVAQDNRKMKKKFFLLGVIFIIISLIVLFVLSHYINFIRIQNIISNRFIRNHNNNYTQTQFEGLKYLGNLKYERFNYNATFIGKNKILIIGNGITNSISQKAEIYDFDKKKTTKIIKLNYEHYNDFLYKISENKIQILGKNIEVVDIKKSKAKKIDIDRTQDKKTEAYATKIDDDNLLIIIGDKYKKGKNFYIYNIKTEKITEKDIELDADVFNPFYEYHNPLININNNIYFVGCNHLIDIDKDNNKIYDKYFNCGIFKYSKENEKFEKIYDFNKSIIPFNIIKKDEDNIFIISNKEIIEYNIKENIAKYLISKNSDEIQLNAQFVEYLNHNQLLFLGNSVVTSNNCYIYTFESNELKKCNNDTYNDKLNELKYGFGKSITTNDNKIIFIGLFKYDKRIFILNKQKVVYMSLQVRHCLTKKLILLHDIRKQYRIIF